MEQKKYELEDRFIDFASNILGIADALPDTGAGNYLGEQLIKSSFSPMLHYGEAQNSGSRNDFIQKMSAVLQELKGCRIALKIIRKKEMIKPAAKLEAVYGETEHLIAIIGKSISTAKKNKGKAVPATEN
ncbi:MAG TPA: four helix bundle protein [Chitinophagaceae bacterium]|jgi:four helix bundle protein|nr:four helix bundle protein [Chitinophagaceae bacterium]